MATNAYDEMLKKLAERNAADRQKFEQQRQLQATTPVPGQNATNPAPGMTPTPPQPTITQPASQNIGQPSSAINNTPQTGVRPLEFTPKQVETMMSKYGSKQALYDDVIKRGMASGQDGNAILNALNVAFEGVNMPSRIDAGPIGGPEGIKNDLPATTRYFDDMISQSNNPEATAQLTGMRNDYSSFFERNNEIANKVDQWFPGLYDMIQKSGELGNQVGEEFLNKLEVDREMFLQRNEELKKRVADTYANSAAILNNVYGQEMARSASSAAATGMTGGPAAVARARVNAEVFQLQDQLAKEELEQYKQINNTVDEYMRRYLQTFGQSRDKSVVDNFNNLLNIKSSLTMNIANLEMQERDMASRAAENAALANALGGQGQGGTGSSEFAGGGEAIPNIPLNRRPGGGLRETPLRENVEPRNPSLFERLPNDVQQTLLNTYGTKENIPASVGNEVAKNPTPSIAQQVINSQREFGSITNPTTMTDAAISQYPIRSEAEASERVSSLQNKLNELNRQLSTYSNQVGSTQYNMIRRDIQNTKSLLDKANNDWLRFRLMIQ